MRGCSTRNGSDCCKWSAPPDQFAQRSQTEDIVRDRDPAGLVERFAGMFRVQSQQPRERLFPMPIKMVGGLHKMGNLVKKRQRSAGF
jgi:hypothetical protein